MPIDLAAPFAGLLAGAAALAAGAALWRRKPAMPRPTLVCLLVAAACLALAAADPLWRRRGPARVLVMVDLSASTRTARYRDPATLARRLDELLGNTPRRVVYFAEDTADAPPGRGRLEDLPGRITRFQPPATETAVLLFSDGRFDAPAAPPPTHVIVDEGLLEPPDAAVERMEVRGQRLVVAVRNGGSARTLSLTAGPVLVSLNVPPGGLIQAVPLPPDVGTAVAALSGGDPWPENDGLSLPIASPERAERWWVSDSPPPDESWTRLSPTELAVSAGAWLRPAVVALDNIPAERLSSAQQNLLAQYVKDLGGGLLLLGGEKAFAAGGYSGTPLDAVSPLAADPPTPTFHWTILVDASGSMARRAGAVTRWDMVREALFRTVAALPPEDLLSVGGFAAEVRWWVRGETVRLTRNLPLPPAGTLPRGPTNLRPAIVAAIEAAEGDLPKPLLLLTDAEARIDDERSLADGLRRNRMSLSVVAIESGEALPALRRLAEGSGGAVVEQFEPDRWSEALREAARAAAGERLIRPGGRVKFLGALSALPARDAPVVNRTWLRDGAEELARSGDGPPAAIWQVGEGKVLSAAMPLSAQELLAAGELVARPPRDPRLSIEWTQGRDLEVRVDAMEAGAPVDALDLVLEVLSGSQTTHRTRLGQVGPGIYRAAVPTPRAGGLAVVRLEGAAVDRIAFAGRYDPEFESIGFDRDAMDRLARMSGGRVIEPQDRRPLDLSLPARPSPLAPWLLGGAAALLAAGLVVWRLR